MAVPLTPQNLAAYLNQRYPDRWPGHLDEIEDLISDDLAPAGFTTVDEVAQMLTRTNDAFLADERDNPNTASGELWGGVATVRGSLRLDKGA
jgi:hypothetical protein